MKSRALFCGAVSALTHTNSLVRTFFLSALTKFLERGEHFNSFLIVDFISKLNVCSPFASRPSSPRPDTFGASTMSPGGKAYGQVAEACSVDMPR
mmetsp:Transcript_10940/g.15695  ORF Transcript_10940/g.15695 Transcript_10940/m.15695 type:complete len:95 (-) Transcript_10940:842-1126(-)